MEIQEMQSMDWLFKKERIYLLAQFWQQRATLAEKEVNTLKEQLQSNVSALSPNPLSSDRKMAASPSPNENADINRSAIDLELSAKDREISQLVEDVQRLQSSIGKLQETSASQIARLEEDLDLKRQHILRLEARLEAQRDYEELKRQLRLARDDSPESLQNKEPNSILASSQASQIENSSSTEDLSPHKDSSNNVTCDSTDLKPDDLVMRAPSPSSQHKLMPPISAPTSQPLNPTHSLPPPLQNVEQFGPILGEEIVSNWRKTIERNVINSINNIHHKKINNLIHNNALMSLNHNNNNNIDINNKNFTDPKVRQNGLDLMINKEVMAKFGNNFHSEPEDKLVNGKKSTASSIADPDGTIDDPSPTLPTPPQQTSSATSNPNSSPTLNLDQKSPCKSPGDDVTNNNIFVNGGLMNNIFNNNNNSSNNFNDIIKPYRFDDAPHHHHHPVYRFANSTGDSNNIMPRFGESLIPKSDPMEARLQEMLRYNMDKYSTQSLDTLYISRRVRELLSVHNVGQRLFAKYILGLSQGTVSELLSKPKPWDKLTEKGRDSYRKMHAWACDENAVMLLKTLIPKKGTVPNKDSTGMHSIFNKSEPDISGDDRLAHILTEAGHLMRHQEQDSRSNDDASPHHNQCPSPLSRENSLNRRLKKYENDDIPQDQVVRIYQEELSKLMGRRFDESQPFPGLLFPHFFNNNLNNVPTNEQEIRLALETYHRELAKLNSTQQAPPTSLPIPNFLLHPSLGGLQQLTQNVQDLSVPKSLSSPADRKLSISSDKNNQNGDSGRLVDSPVDRKDSGGKTPDSVSTTDSMRHQIGSSSAFSLVRPKLEPGTTPVGGSGSAASSPLGGSNIILPPEDFSPSAASSPLQRMASITNALISQPSTPHHHSSAQRPLKAVLPPITQQQFDQYNNLNTEDIVRRVKEQLSQFSISQRLFGESVLGLSQGSVSDLLARPKPWHMLTQKGREPFIRMKMFLEDDNAVHKLVASQYKIAPEKLMRTGGYGGPPILPPQAMGKPLQPSPALTPNSLIKNSTEDRERDNSSRDSSREREREMRQHFMTSPQQQMFAQHHMEQLKKQQQQAQSQNIPQPPQSPHSVVLQHQAAAQAQAHAQQQVNAALRNLGHHVAPSVYEMAALTQDLDTQVITTKIKEALLANNIGQKIFGEAVLGLSQGSVSELLSKPKPWHMLSIKGREPFIRMQLWLSDSHNVERLQAIKTERRELSKRRRGSGAQDNSDDTSSNDTSDFYHGGGGGSPPLSAKKQRVLFSEEQKEALRLAFTLDPYPSVNTIEFLASELNLAARTITNWFHNHRMRLKQHNPNAANSAEINREVSNAGSGGFDPIQFRLLLSQRLAGLNNLNIPPLLTHPYFPGNPEIANLIRGFPNVLNAEQMYGLDLSVKQAEDGMDGMSGEEMDGSEEEGDEEMAEVQAMNRENESSRSSRRKPAAPQWVNPEWQESEPEVIINGVCVMQTSDDYRANDQSETIRVEPTPVLEDEETEDPPRSHDRSPQRSPDIKRETSPTPDCNEDLSIKREPERDDESDF